MACFVIPRYDTVSPAPRPIMKVNVSSPSASFFIGINFGCCGDCLLVYLSTNAFINMLNILRYKSRLTLYIPYWTWPTKALCPWILRSEKQVGCHALTSQTSASLKSSVGRRVLALTPWRSVFLSLLLLCQLHLATPAGGKVCFPMSC